MKIYFIFGVYLIIKESGRAVSKVNRLLKDDSPYISLLKFIFILRSLVYSNILSQCISIGFRDESVYVYLVLNQLQAPSQMTSLYLKLSILKATICRAAFLFFLLLKAQYFKSKQKRIMRTRAIAMNKAIESPIYIILVTNNNLKNQINYHLLIVKIISSFLIQVKSSGRIEYNQDGLYVILLFYLFILQVMEINKPDAGVFKGIGKLEMNKQINKKYFPTVRNINQFQYTHHHKNDYLSSFQRFFSHNKPPKTLPLEKPKQYSNQSTLHFGQDGNNYYNSLSRTDYKRFDKFVPPKLIIPKEEGVQLGNTSLEADSQYMTTAMEKFGQKNIKQMTKVSFKDRGLKRFNPITGEDRILSFGFQDFSMNRKNNYVANNLTFIPQKNQKYDIISGRKITFN